MFKRVKVVLLPTNQKSKLFIGKISGQLHDIAIADKDSSTLNQNLYILSDEKVKEGDWFLRTHFMGVPIDGIPVKAAKFVEEKQSYMGNYIMKIIASTDSLLITSQPIPNSITFVMGVIPSPSPSFIEKYINEYNKGNIITEVMVEYDSTKDVINSMTKEYFNGNTSNINLEILKINLKDNTITIKKIKDSWNKEEIEQQLVYCVSELAASFGYASTSEEMKKWNEATHKWVKNNL